MESLEILGPYTLTTGLRDSMVWEYSDGAKVQWICHRRGIGGPCSLFQNRFAGIMSLALRQNLEIIAGPQRESAYLKHDFWKQYPKARAAEFAKFLAMAKRGKPLEPHHSADKKAEQDYQKSELERSLKYAGAEVIGLGLQ